MSTSALRAAGALFAAASTILPASVLSAGPAPTNQVPNSATSGPVASGRAVWMGTCHVLTAPARWDRRDVTEFCVDAVAVVGTALLLDRPVRDYVDRHASRGSDADARLMQHFGAEYSFGVLAAFYGGGAAMGNENAMDTAKDGLESSFIAAGLITPSLKFAVGRNRPNRQVGAFDFHPLSGAASWPSGHTTQAFAVAAAVSGHYDSPWVDAVSYGTASLVGVARIERKTHFASDVLAGALIGMAVGRTVVHMNRHANPVVTLAPMIGVEAVGAQLNIAF